MHIKKVRNNLFFCYIAPEAQCSLYTASYILYITFLIQPIWTQYFIVAYYTHIYDTLTYKGGTNYD